MSILVSALKSARDQPVSTSDGKGLKFYNDMVVVVVGRGRLIARREEPVEIQVRGARDGH